MNDNHENITTQPATEPAPPPEKKRRKQWSAHKFGDPLPPLKPFDLQPVSDIPIRLAVEEGAIKNRHDLALYQLSEDWQDWRKGSVIIAGVIAPGQPFALWKGEFQKDSPPDDSPPENSA